MKKPTVTQAYAMIRHLKKRNAAGDGEKIEQLKAEIEAQKDSSAQLDVDRYFAQDPAAAAPSKPRPVR